jgi:signal transduction histidine kinase
VLKHDRRPETVTKAIDVVDRNCRRQTQMIDDLLDIGRIVAGKLRLDVQRVDVTSVIEEALACGAAGGRRQGRAPGEGPGSSRDVLGDAGRLQQVVWNL